MFCFAHFLFIYTFYWLHKGGGLRNQYEKEGREHGEEREEKNIVRKLCEEKNHV